MTISRQEIGLLSALTVLALIAGWISGGFGWAFFGVTLLWIAIQLRSRSRFTDFSRHPLRRPVNDPGPWQDISLRLYRTIRQARSRHRATLDRFKVLRSITDALPDAAVVIDVAGNIENLNNAARKLLRLNRSDRGNHLSSLIRDPSFAALIRGEIEGDLIEWSSPFVENSRLEARRIDMAAGRNMILVRDVTELNRLLSMRQDFIANVSHELRTPLTVIVGYIETLMNEELDPRTTNELIAKLLSPTTRMRALVDDLLLLTRLESSPKPVGEELDVVDMGVIISAIANDAKMLSAGRHDIEVSQRSSAQLLGIDSEMHSACLNLVTNAVRYSPDGGAIRISWEDVASGVRFAVEDHGMGIPREHLPRITERFYRVDLAQSRVRGGTGLGLAIVKHVLKRHNSQLQVKSELARGSTFFCDFPESQLA